MGNNLAQLLKYKNITASTFADNINVQRSGISHILSGRNKPSLEFIQKVLKAYPEINPDWLIFGKGSMLRQPDLFADSDNSPIPDAKNNIIAKAEKKTSSKKASKNQNHVISVDNTDFNQEFDKAFSGLKKEKSQTKTIEKILVFYSNGTFKEYLPE